MAGQTDLAQRPGVAAVRQGDHVCWSYDGDQTHADVLVPYFTAGLEAQEQLHYYATSAGVSWLLSLLAATGLDTDALQASGRLVVGDVVEAYLPGGRFDAQACADGFQAAAHRALADGFSGIRVAGENGAVFDHPQLRGQWFDYELMVDHLMTVEPIVGMCCFDRRLCDRTSLAMLDAVHRVQLADDTAPRSAFHVHARRDGSLALSGEVEYFTGEVIQRLLEGPAARLDGLAVDVSELRFIDGAGIRALERVAEARVREGRTPIELRGARPFLRRVLGLVSSPGGGIVLTPAASSWS